MLRAVHNAQMATKTISLKLEAYERLLAVRRYASESFSQIVLRARWPEDTVTGRSLLERCRQHGPFFSEDDLDRITEMKAKDAPPEDKWQTS